MFNHAITFGIARYPAIILALIGLAYLFFTPGHFDDQSQRRQVAKYACRNNPNIDWCRELREDLAHGRKERARNYKPISCTTDTDCRIKNGGHINRPY